MAEGAVFTDGSIRTIRTSANQFKKFQQSKKRKYDFGDFDPQFYYDFSGYLKKRDYSINTAGIIIDQLKWIMAQAESEGYHHDTIYKNPKFKGNRVQVDSICLTREELDKMNAADLSSLEAGAAISRDIFMVGVYTAQRISDYNKIRKEDIHTTTNRKQTVEYYFAFTLCLNRNLLYICSKFRITELHYAYIEHFNDYRKCTDIYKETFTFRN